jgi:hypothetical protein
MEIKNIALALLKAQSEMSNPVKGSNNPYFKSKYADLNSVREATIPILNTHGIVVLQPMVNIDGRNFVNTILLHESGETIESFTEIIYTKTNDAQAQGSGITYARRYGLQSLVCVGADDDDGNAASNPQKKPDKKPEPTPPPISPEPFDTEKYEAEISGITNKEDMKAYWDAHKDLKSNPEFSALITKYGKSLK